MKNFKIDSPLVERISMVRLLNSLGYKPLLQNKDELRYASIFGNKKNRDAFLHVNLKLNCWFDRAISKGGGVADFAYRYWPNKTSNEIENKLFEINKPPKYRSRTLRKRIATKIPFYNIEQIYPLGHTNEITNFLKLIGLWVLADLNIKEVHYYLVDQSGRRKDFRAVGWLTENGGWQLLSEHYKGFIGPIGITLISLSKVVVSIFFEYIDYLKNRSERSVSFSSKIILNHPSCFEQAIQRTINFKKVVVYSNQSLYACQLTKKFKARLPQVEVVTL